MYHLETEFQTIGAYQETKGLGLGERRLHLTRQDFDGDGGWVEGVTANVVALCEMRDEAADSHNCSFLQGETDSISQYQGKCVHARRYTGHSRRSG